MHLRDEQRAGLVHPIGGTFVREADTLRSALDSALTSPYAIAVAVEPETGCSISPRRLLTTT